MHTLLEIHDSILDHIIVCANKLTYTVKQEGTHYLIVSTHTGLQANHLDRPNAFRKMPQSKVRQKLDQHAAQLAANPYVFLPHN